MRDLQGLNSALDDLLESQADTIMTQIVMGRLIGEFIDESKGEGYFDERMNKKLNKEREDFKEMLKVRGLRPMSE